MGQAKRRKDAGEYPQLNGVQPTKQARTGMKFDPSCGVCGGSGNAGSEFIPAKGGPSRYVQKTCRCAECMMPADVRDVIDYGVGLGNIKRAAVKACAETRMNAEQALK